MKSETEPKEKRSMVDVIHTESLRASDHYVRPIELWHGQQLVMQHHYARGGSNTAVFMHGLFHRSKLGLLGCAWWIPPTKGAAIASYPEGDWKRVLTLSRLVIVPGSPKNAATFLMSQSRKLVALDSRWECLTTYADAWQGHQGAIYRADNWQSCGMTKPEAVWVDDSGRMVSRKRGPRTLTKAEMLGRGYQCLGKFSKHKFRRIIIR